MNDRRLQRLSAEHYRTFVNALLWSVTNRTDGRIEREDVGLIPHWSANAAKAFVDAGLFTPQSDGWLITDYAATQTARSELETLERIRQRERVKKAKQRAEKLAGGADDEDSPGDDDGDSPGEASPGTAQEGRKAGNEGERVPTAAGLHGPPSLTELPKWRGAGPNPFEEYA